ncbi:MAG: hypothetical protein JWP44_2519 [Mucilaginibacter sp.]|nr:hypothetical protein [Mucilaginibacter sp.]
MKKIFLFYLLILIGGCFMAGCGNNEKPAGGTAVIPKKTVVMEPFRFHKLIEVSPGQDYDILSWGRGSATTGSFEILHSDSAAAKFTTTTGDLDGTIVDVYNSDMDLDGNPEILIQAKGKDTNNYTNIYAFEFSNNSSKAQKLDFPKLTKKQRQGYRGQDSFYIEDGKLFREFPVYDGNGKDAKATGQKRKFEYGLRNNEFTIKELSKDSTKAVTTAPVKNKEPEQQATITKNNKSESHKSKKHKAESHKKKRKKHHHSSEG